MTMRAPGGRISDEPAFLLHAVPYRETSLVVDLFTREYGRIAAVAKGAKRPRSALRAVLLQFQPLRVGFSGRQELRTLIAAEWTGGLELPRGRALLSAFYLNELLQRLLQREDAHPALFDGYWQAIATLAASDAHDDALRRFEWLLLRETGYAPDLGSDVESVPIEPAGHYGWIPGGGFERTAAAEQGGGAMIVGGVTLRSLASGVFESNEARQQAKYLTRAILAHHLDGVPLRTRQILLDLQRL